MTNRLFVAVLMVWFLATAMQLRRVALRRQSVMAFAV